MGKGLQRSIRSAHPTEQKIVRWDEQIDGEMSLTGASGNGWGTFSLLGLPRESRILVLAMFADLRFDGTEATSANLSNTWNGDVSIGEEASVNNNALAGNEISLAASKALGPAVSQVASATLQRFASKLIDASSSAKDVHLNLRVDNANIGADVTLKVTGTISLIGIVI